MKVRVKSLVRNVVEKSDGTPQPFIGLEDIESGTGRLVTDEPPEKAANDSIVHRSGDVLFSKLRPYLAKSFLPGRRGTATGELFVLRPSERLDPRFLFYVTLSQPWIDWANTTSYGSKMPRTSWELLADYRIWRPPREEQRRIADFLDAETARIDRLSAKRRRMKELLTMKRECIVEFELGVDCAGSAQHTLVPLKYLAGDITVGIVITPARWYVDHDGVPALRGVNVKPGRIVREDVTLVSTQGHLANQKSHLRAGDVVVVRTGQAGAAAVVPPDFEGANCIDLVVIRPGTKLAPRYVEYVLNSGYAGRRVDEYSVGSIQGHFNVGAMKQIPFPALPRSEQERAVHRIDSLVEPIDHLIRRLNQQDSVLQERRRALITAAVTGQFDVSAAARTTAAPSPEKKA